MKRYRFIATASLAVLLAGPFTTAFAAEDSAGSSAADSEAAQADHYTDEQLKQFVEAQNNVQDAIAEWQPKVAEAEDAEAREEAKREKSEALVDAVEDSGLSPETYNNIAQAASKDPALTKRIQSFMEPQ